MVVRSRRRREIAAEEVRQQRRDAAATKIQGLHRASEARALVKKLRSDVVSCLCLHRRVSVSVSKTEVSQY